MTICIAHFGMRVFCLCSHLGAALSTASGAGFEFLSFKRSFKKFEVRMGGIVRQYQKLKRGIRKKKKLTQSRNFPGNAARMSACECQQPPKLRFRTDGGVSDPQGHSCAHQHYLLRTYIRNCMAGHDILTGVSERWHLGVLLSPLLFGIHTLIPPP